MNQKQIEELGKTVYAICKELSLGADKSPVTVAEFAKMRAQIAVALITRSGMQDVSQSLDGVVTGFDSFGRIVESKNFC